MSLVLKVDKVNRASNFVALFLQLEVSRFFSVSVHTPNHLGPLEISITPNPEVPDIHGTWKGLLKRSFENGMLHEWRQYITKDMI